MAGAETSNTETGILGTSSQRCAVEVARRFIEAPNARDLEMRSTLVTEDVECQTSEGHLPRGYGLEAIVRAAADADLLLARRAPKGSSATLASCA